MEPGSPRIDPYPRVPETAPLAALSFVFTALLKTSCSLAISWKASLRPELCNSGGSVVPLNVNAEGFQQSRRAIDLEELPSPSTLCKAFNRLDMAVWRVLLNLSVTLLPTNGVVGTTQFGACVGGTFLRILFLMPFRIA